jgi:hypothetical protein
VFTQRRKIGDSFNGKQKEKKLNGLQSYQYFLFEYHFNLSGFTFGNWIKNKNEFGRLDSKFDFCIISGYFQSQ